MALVEAKKKSISQMGADIILKANMITLQKDCESF